MGIDIRSWGLSATADERSDGRRLACMKGGQSTTLARKYFRMYQEAKKAPEASGPSPREMMAQASRATDSRVQALKQAAMKFLQVTEETLEDTPEWQELAKLV